MKTCDEKREVILSLCSPNSYFIHQIDECMDYD